MTTTHMYEDLVEEQNDILYVIKLEQDEIVNGVNVTWLSEISFKGIYKMILYV